MSEYVLRLIEHDLARPSLREWFATLRTGAPIRPRRMKGQTLVDVLHEARREQGYH